VGHSALNPALIGVLNDRMPVRVMFTLFAAIALLTIFTACNSSGKLGGAADAKDTMTGKTDKITQTSGQAGRQVTVQGTAHFRGDAVRCPEIKIANGDIVGVSKIPGTIAMGTLIEVSGEYGYMTTCNGKVIIVETLKQI